MAQPLGISGAICDHEIGRGDGDRDDGDRDGLGGQFSAFQVEPCEPVCVVYCQVGP